MCKSFRCVSQQTIKLIDTEKSDAILKFAMKPKSYERSFFIRNKNYSFTKKYFLMFTTGCVKIQNYIKIKW